MRTHLLHLLSSFVLGASLVGCAAASPGTSDVDNAAALGADPNGGVEYVKGCASSHTANLLVTGVISLVDESNTRSTVEGALVELTFAGGDTPVDSTPSNAGGRYTLSLEASAHNGGAGLARGINVTYNGTTYIPTLRDPSSGVLVDCDTTPLHFVFKPGQYDLELSQE
jgi:hypothetical protein